MYISVTEKISKTGFGYLVASLIVAVSAAVYGMFSHGVHSPFMTFAFLIPLIGGAAPHIAGAVCGWESGDCLRRLPLSPAARDVQLAVIATLTAGSLLEGALDIYGTTNRLIIVYPLIALLILAVSAALVAKKK